MLFSCSFSVVQAEEPITPLPTSVELDPAKVALGQKLFMDKRLSHGDENACSSCHLVSRGGADGQRLSPGLAGHAGVTNTLTIFNALLNYRLNWDGRTLSPSSQVQSAIADPTLMGSNWPEIMGKLSADSGLTAAFRNVYPDGMSAASITDAIVTYERSLITPDAPFDRYLRGDVTALDGEEIEGYRLFKDYGCTSCHQGQNVGGNMLQVLGVVGEPGQYFKASGTPTQADLGRYNRTGDEADRFVFRVPSLRNVAVTAPYFNNGSIATLPDAIRAMARYQLGRQMPDRDVDLIAAFLKTLTGEYRGKSLAQWASEGEPDLAAGGEKKQ